MGVTVPQKIVTPKSIKKKDSSELEVINYLRKCKSEDILVKQYHLKSVKHKTYLNLIQFSYSQVGCDMSSPIVQECRGIILDSKNNWNVVAFPYTKFFNYGDPEAHEIDWR